MVNIFIGLIVGLTMGLTGAGGALISIPLFMTMKGASLKEATVLSLLAVLLGTILNLIGQFRQVDKKIVVVFWLSGALSTITSLKIKGGIPEYVIAGVLACVGFYSLWGVWSKSQNSYDKEGGTDNLLKLFVVGLFLGLITTITGLGGGVVLVPILIKLFGKDYKEALPTSLATIFLIALTSFLFQIGTIKDQVTIEEIAFMGIGSVISYILLKRILKLLKEDHTTIIRKFVFTMVTVYSVGNVIVKIM